MATILRMPAVMANATEAVISGWAVEEGAVFAAGDALAEVETEKALVDVVAEEDGILARFIAAPGDSTAVGAPMAVLIAAGETEADIAAALASIGSGPGAQAGESQARPGGEDESIAEAAQPAEAVEAPKSLEAPERGRLFASPIARRLVRENGLELEDIDGTGPGGRIVRADVDAALLRRAAPQGTPAARVEQPAARQPISESSPRAFTEVPLTGMRRAIARRLTESTSTVPHFFLTADCMVDDLLALRAQINAASARPVSLNDLIVKAAAAAFVDVPEANVTWADTHLRRWEHVDIGVAVATDGGLVTPVVRGVERLALGDLSRSIADLVERGRAGRLRQDELEGGSFSVTNLGMFGTRAFSAIINPPQSAILAVGAASPRAVIVGGNVTSAMVMTVTLSVDHRAIDGALAAQWLAAFEKRIAHPLGILV